MPEDTLNAVRMYDELVRQGYVTLGFHNWELRMPTAYRTVPTMLAYSTPPAPVTGPEAPTDAKLGLRSKGSPKGK